jgi:hypothetical protein
MLECLLRFPGTLAVLLLFPATAHAARVTVTMKGNGRVEGELIEGVTNDYVLVRDDLGRTRQLSWRNIHRIDGRNPEALPWPSRLTFGGQLGVTSLNVETMNAYLSSGLTLGGYAGWAFYRSVAVIASYEATWPGSDVRNRGAQSQLSHFAGAGARLTSNTVSDDVGFYSHVLFGMRTIAYKFDPSDGSGNEWFVPTGPMSERASMTGWELRLAIGVALTPTRDVSLDMFGAASIGEMRRYSDTLSCSTFGAGPCGAHRLSTSTFGAYVATRFH